MTEKEFIIWFKGFVSAANTFNITPKQWDTICEYLEKVKYEDINTRNNSYIIDNKWATTTITADARNDVSYKINNSETKTILND